MNKTYLQLQLRVDASGQPVPKHNHVNEHRGGNANAAVLRHCGGLFQHQRHDGIQRHANDDGMHHHG
jgi:hypothetical protein